MELPGVPAHCTMLAAGDAGQKKVYLINGSNNQTIKIPR
jgi:hypothetical protein